MPKIGTKTLSTIPAAHDKNGSRMFFINWISQMLCDDAFVRNFG